MMENINNNDGEQDQMFADQNQQLLRNVSEQQAGAEEQHQGSGQASATMVKQGSQVGLFAAKKPLNIVRPVLLDQTQQASLPPKKATQPKTTTNSKAQNSLMASPKGRVGVKQKL